MSTTAKNVAVVIPARYASSRFPGKPLAKIAGISMIERTYTQSKKARNVSRVIVATDDERIQNEVTSFGGEVVMTREDHPTGTDRLAEVALRFPEVQIIINVQGDEPLIDPAVIEAVTEPLLQDSSIAMSTACFKIADISEALQPTLVKVVTDQHGFAMYFSRHAIPFYRNNVSDADKTYFGHMGIYGYTRECLLRLAALPPTPIEQAEVLEQLRALENGIKIKVIRYDTRSAAVDIPEDIAKVEKALTVLTV